MASISSKKLLRLDRECRTDTESALDFHTPFIELDDAIYHREAYASSLVSTASIDSEEPVEYLFRIGFLHTNPGVTDSENHVFVVDGYSASFFIVSNRILKEIGEKYLEVVWVNVECCSFWDIDFDFDILGFDVFFMVLDDFLYLQKK